MAHRGVLSAQEKALIDLALERGVNPSDLKGGFAWASLLPLLPLITKPVEKLIDKGTDKLFNWMGMGFTPTGANALPPMRCGGTYPVPTRTFISAANDAAKLEAVKKEIMPYTKDPEAFKSKLE